MSERFALEFTDPTVLHACDAAACARLHALGFAAPWSADQFADWVGDPQVQLLGCHSCGTGKLAGLIAARTVCDEAEILTFVVDPQRRRQGLARSILCALCERLQDRGVATLFLDVADDNAAAIALYTSMEFTCLGRRKAYYSRSGGQTRVDALTLSRSL